MQRISNRLSGLYWPIQLFIFLAFFGCKKDAGPAKDPPANEPVSPSNPIANACSASRADAENMMIFPADNAWNRDISNDPIDASSSQIIANISTASLKADFGSGLWEGAHIGIPFVVICGNQQETRIQFRENGYDGNYGDESDAGPYPIPLNAPIEGNGGGDAHVIAVDKENGILYELYNASVDGDHWGASSGAVFNLASNASRTPGFTSADAAGLPIFPGLVRYDEVVKGVIDHAIRFTLSKANVKSAYIAPASHKVNSTGGQYSLPFGAKIRLKKDYNISVFTPEVQIILKAMKTYGLILADIGSNMYFSGAPGRKMENNDDLHQLGSIKAGDFEVVRMN